MHKLDKLNQAYDYVKHLNVNDKVIQYLCQDIFYLPGYFSEENDFRMLNKLLQELTESDGGLFRHADRFRHTSPDESPTYLMILNQMAKLFNLIILGHYMNYYPDGQDEIKYHHDAHKVVGGVKEDFTVGVSFGQTRDMHFDNRVDRIHFQIPQRNGDVFAFNTVFNSQFKHAVLKDHTNGPRISIVIWGKVNTDRNQSLSTNVRGNEKINLENIAMQARFLEWQKQFGNGSSQVNLKRKRRGRDGDRNRREPRNTQERQSECDQKNEIDKSQQEIERLNDQENQNEMYKDTFKPNNEKEKDDTQEDGEVLE